MRSHDILGRLASEQHEDGRPDRIVDARLGLLLGLPSSRHVRQRWGCPATADAAASSGGFPDRAKGAARGSRSFRMTDISVSRSHLDSENGLCR